MERISYTVSGVVGNVSGVRTKTWTLTGTERNCEMYSRKQVLKALRLYRKCGSVTKTIRILGYPSRESMYLWIKNSEYMNPRDRIDKRPPHKCHLSIAEKEYAVKRCFYDGESVKSVSEELGCSTTSLYLWRDKYLRGGTVSLMENNRKDTHKADVSEMSELENLKAQIRDLQMEVDILKGILDVLKKDPGTDWRTLKNREKAVMIGAMKNNYPLPILLKKFEISKSSYYYQVNALTSPDKYMAIRKKIKQAFHDNRDCYGYRRIHSIMKNDGTVISEKVVRRLMKEEGLVVTSKRKRKYSSYKGEITPAVPNLVNRDFHSDKPGKLLLTDITEFSLPAGKVYLSPVVDCFDGYLPTWTISLRPNANLVNTMLDNLAKKLKDGAKPIIHTDRGCHYRWPGWIGRMQANGWIRSMSKKGCSPDNSACEGFFGRLKNEFFYCRDWTEASLKEFIRELDNYLHWYNEDRIKESLGYMSPKGYRASLGIAV